jgi:uncharacterized protein involved in exopolysaccharide biosynthesis
MSDLTPNNDPFLQNPYPDDEIDLKELFMVLWGGKWLISAVTGLSAAISVVVALSLPNIYTASALLAPTESSGGSLSGLMKQYGGLASLAGVSIPGQGEGSRARLAIQLMKSRVFLGDFVDRRGILPDLIAVESWDEGSGEVSYDPEVYNAETNEWHPKSDAQKSSTPSRQQAHAAFSAILSVSQESQTGYVSVSIQHQSPILAAQWVNWLVKDVNAEVKFQDVSEAERSIEFLKQQAANTSLADLQAMFFELIQSQTETMMLAEVRPEYVFKTIDPAVTPETKSNPNRRMICVLGTLFGAILGVVIVVIRHYTRS